MSGAGAAKATEPVIIGRYALFDELASGGMATVHLGRLLGPVGFGRTVAVKRLHTHYTTDQDFVTMFMDEARIVSRIVHPNVVPMVDVVESSKGLFLVMEYVHGESFSKLLRACRAAKDVPPYKIACAIMHGVLLGLHAAHETKGAKGELIDIVHRDVSPQNIMVGADGAARVLDFGIAKAAGRAQVTREGQIKGKLAYMAPEQVRGVVDRRADVFAASVVLWEAVAGRRLHEGMKDVDIVTRIVSGTFDPPSKYVPSLPKELDAIVSRGLAADPKQRYATARDMALDLERWVGLASPSVVGEWVERLAKDTLAARAARVSAMEVVASSLSPADSVPPPGFPGPVSTRDIGELSAPFEDVDVGSGSALTPHSDPTRATPSAAEIPIVAPPRGTSTLAVVMASFVGFLVLAGVGFGVYSNRLTASQAAAPEPSATSVDSTASVTSATSATASASATPVAKASASAARAPAPPTGISSRRPTAPSSAASSSSDPEATGPSVSASASASAAPSASSHPHTWQRPPPPPPPKKSCDPPYTIDENGHRHYKMECMGGD